VPWKAACCASRAITTTPIACRHRQNISRAASLLIAIGLPELIADTEAKFRRVAIELAGDSDWLAAVTTRLAQNRLTQPLFDTSLYVGHLEQPCAAMIRRHEDGFHPDHIDLTH
jgi:protein O-GlcNAc transferase